MDEHAQDFVVTDQLSHSARARCKATRDSYVFSKCVVTELAVSHTDYILAVLPRANSPQHRTSHAPPFAVVSISRCVMYSLHLQAILLPGATTVN
jgi:hypothetical protein